MALPSRIDNYLQQIVTLTTTSEIRYEGRLVSFDLNNNSITLRDVRKFGTEDRRAPMQVAGDSKKYDYIVFHYNGIQSLTLKRGPNQMDPAIMSMSGDHSGYMSRHQQLTHQLPRMQSSLRNVDVRNLMSHERKPYIQSYRSQSRDRRRFDDRQPRGSQGERHVSFSIGRPKRSESRGRMVHIPHVPRSALGRVKNHDGKKKENQSRRSVSVTLSQPGKFSKPKKTEKFDEDFDFDKELQKFDKLTLTDGNIEEKKEDEDVDEIKKIKEAYNPDNFFDNLTSMKETEKPKRSRKDEKEANRETFGVGHIRPKMKFSDRRFHGKFNVRNAHRRATMAI